MRIIAGDWRGRPLTPPEGDATRPTSDRAKEGLFSILASRVGSFHGLYVADIFAGTGALGLEALSRGAAHCTFVEKDRTALASLKQNIERFSASDRIDIRSQPVEHAPPPQRPCDILLLDPPYGTTLGAMALARLCNPLWVAPHGYVSLETSGDRPDIPGGYTLDTERRFGKAHIFLLRSDP